MRKIVGFVCLVTTDGTEVLFGKNTTEGGRGHYESFYTNNLTPFLSILEAEIAKVEILNRSDASSVSLAELKLEIAETEEEMESFRDREQEGLVVIRETPEIKETILIGAPVEGKSRYPVYGSLLDENGYKPFTVFDSAEYTAREEHRQTGGCPVSIAIFSLKRL